MRTAPSTTPKKRLPCPRLKKPAASKGTPRKKSRAPAMAIAIVTRMVFALNLDLSVGLADSDGVGGATAHHDALEHGLTAVEELLLAHRRAHPSPCLTPPATLGSTGWRVISSAAGAAGTGRRGPGCRQSAAGR